jgi:hypothetical protein
VRTPPICRTRLRRNRPVSSTTVATPATIGGPMSGAMTVAPTSTASESSRTPETATTLETTVNSRCSPNDGRRLSAVERSPPGDAAVVPADHLAVGVVLEARGEDGLGGEHDRVDVVVDLGETLLEVFDRPGGDEHRDGGGGGGVVGVAPDGVVEAVVAEQFANATAGLRRECEHLDDPDVLAGERAAHGVRWQGVCGRVMKTYRASRTASGERGAASENASSYSAATRRRSVSRAASPSVGHRVAQRAVRCSPARSKRRRP